MGDAAPKFWHLACDKCPRTKLMSKPIPDARGRWWRRTATGCLVLALSAHGDLAGQTVEESEQGAAARPGWIFTPSFSVSGGWDDNVLLLGTGVSPLADYVTALTPAGRLDYNGRRLQLSSSYRGSFQIFRDLTELNTVDQGGRIGLGYRTTPRMTLQLSQRFMRASSTDILELVAVPHRRIGSLNSLTEAGVEARLTARTTARGAYGFRLVEFDEALSDLTFPGGHSHNLLGTVDHRLSKRLTLGGIYTFEHFNVKDDPKPVLLHHAAATGEYRLTEVLAVVGGVGIDYLGEVELQPAHTGLAWKAGVLANWNRISATGSYEQSLQPSFGFSGTVHNKELAGSIRGEFARRRVSWQTSMALRDNEPITSGAAPLRTLWWSAGTGYSLQPWLRIEGYYTFSAQDSVGIPGGRVNRNRVGFQIVTLKAMRLRPGE
jgi:hypothetical protein